MPSYDYECACCGTVFEEKRSFSDTTPVHCPSCKIVSVKRFSPVSVIYKGSGFYTTDSRKSSSASESRNPQDTTVV